MLRIILSLFAIAVVFVSSSFASDTDQITITTYYPAPAGSYNELRTYNNTYLATDGGRVGIGTVNPQRNLHIANDSGNTIVRIEGNQPMNEATMELGTLGSHGYVNMVNGSSFRVRMYDHDKIIVDDTGVGIGINPQPNQVLEVNGNTSIRGDLVIQGTGTYRKNNHEVIKCNFDGTWCYDDAGGGNDFCISCRDGVITGWCGSRVFGRGLTPGNYACGGG